MNVVDSSGWLEYLGHGENAGAFEVILATARSFGAVLWTQDADFEGLDGVRYYAAKAKKK